jgi:hypothetical protein
MRSARIKNDGWPEKYEIFSAWDWVNVGEELRCKDISFIGVI